MSNALWWKEPARGVAPNRLRAGMRGRAGRRFLTTVIASGAHGPCPQGVAEPALPGTPPRGHDAMADRDCKRQPKDLAGYAPVDEKHAEVDGVAAPAVTSDPLSEEKVPNSAGGRSLRALAPVRGYD